MPGPAGRRQELAGLFLAGTVLGDPGGVLERSFDQFRIVEDAEHWRSIAEISLCVPLPPGEGDRVRVYETKRLCPQTQEAVDKIVFPATWGQNRKGVVFFIVTA